MDEIVCMRADSADDPDVPRLDAFLQQLDDLDVADFRVVDERCVFALLMKAESCPRARG
jgi:hypothetical protein